MSDLGNLTLIRKLNIREIEYSGNWSFGKLNIQEIEVRETEVREIEVREIKFREIEIREIKFGKSNSGFWSYTEMLHP